MRERERERERERSNYCVKSFVIMHTTETQRFSLQKFVTQLSSLRAGKIHRTDSQTGSRERERDRETERE